MKKFTNYVKIIAAVICLLWIAPGIISAQAETQAGYIIMSVEKAAIGQDYLMEPQYVPYYEGDTLADVTLRELERLGRRYNYDGRIDSGFYLSEIQDPQRGDLKVPEYILHMIQQQQRDPGFRIEEADCLMHQGVPLYKDFTPEYLGEFDYWTQSGWMYSVNGVYPLVSSCDIKAEAGQILRWQFTMVNYGKDLYGDPAVSAQYRVDREDLCYTLAEVRALHQNGIYENNEDKKILNDSEVKAAYGRCLQAGSNLAALKADISNDLDTLKKALKWNVLTDVTWYDANNVRCGVRYGTTEEELKLPGILNAVKSNGESIQLRIEKWECREGYEPEQPGTYSFIPSISNAYIVQSGVSLPVYEVQVGALGDVDFNGSVDGEDLRKLLPCLNRESEQGAVEQDEEEAVYDLNRDGFINLRDYSILIGAMNHTSVRTETSARIELRLPNNKYLTGDTVTADIVVYSARLDTAAVQLVYNPALIQDVSVRGMQGFTVEKAGTNAKGGYAVLGRRDGAISVSSIKGSCIGQITFRYCGETAPDLSFGAGSQFLLEGREVIGYCNGYAVNFETDLNPGNQTRIIGQLNEGRVRIARFTGETVTENGIEMELAELVFEASDAQDVPENRLRLWLQSQDGGAFLVGDGCVNGDITNPFSQQEQGICYADGENRKAGCFTEGCSPQRETCVLYAKLESDSGIRYCKINVQKMGYEAVSYRYSEQEPLLVNQWDPSEPDVLSACWDPEKLELKEWDAQGNRLEGIHVELPESSEQQGLYFNDLQNRIFAEAPGDYRLNVIGADGGKKGQIRLIAEYPYSAAEELLKEAKEISLEEDAYHSSVLDQLRTYRELVEEMEDLQNSFPENTPVYLDENGRYTAVETSAPVKDSFGYALTGDYIRTEAVLKLKKAVMEIKSVLQNARLRDIAAKITVSQVTYSGNPQTPQIIVTDDAGMLVPDTGFTVKYGNNVNAGTADVTVTGKGYYKGSCTLHFLIRKASQQVTVEKSSYTIQTDTGSCYVKGSTSGDGKISYVSSNASVVRVTDTGKVIPVKAGNAYIKVKAGESSNYLESGEQKIQMKVLAVPSLKVAKTSISKTYGDKAFSLGAKTSKGASITYQSGNRKVATVSARGSVSVKKPGKVLITVKASAKGMGTAVRTVQITIKPKKPSAPSLKTRASRQITVSWKKDSKVTGYEIQAAQDKSFRRGLVTVTVKNYKTTSATLKKLSARKNYYVRVRSYSKSGSTVVNSSWSSVKRIKTK